MLKEEAQWFSDQLNLLDPSNLYPMLNVGSSTEHFRKTQQPWIDELIFRPARLSDHQVIHVDIKPAHGVDLVGDLTDANFRSFLIERRFASVFCSNLLEHLAAPEPVCDAIQQLLPKDGLLFLSCPFIYPYHPDPIDTRLRPTVRDLANMFPHMSVVKGETITDDTYGQRLLASPRTAAKHLLRVATPFYHFEGWRTQIAYFRYTFTHFQATCAILRRD